MARTRRRVDPDTASSGVAEPMHPTAVRLLESAVELLDSVSLDQLSLKMVLDHSEVNQGSLYHHFGGFPELVEHAVVRRYSRNLHASLREIRELLGARDAADFRERILAIAEWTITPERRRNRMERVEVLGALQNRPDLAAPIARVQQELTDAQAALFTEFRRRGWMRDDVDATAQSAFIQAMVLGRIVDDISARPLDRNTWREVALPAFRAVLFGD